MPGSDDCGRFVATGSCWHIDAKNGTQAAIRDFRAGGLREGNEFGLADSRAVGSSCMMHGTNPPEGVSGCRGHGAALAREPGLGRALQTPRQQTKRPPAAAKVSVDAFG